MSTVSLKWVASQLMTGVDSLGHPLVIGTWTDKEPVWAGLKPSDLLLLAAASCTAYDVVMILNKQRQPLQGLEVYCTGEQRPDPPRAFYKIHIHYVIQGECNLERVDRAIRLSEEKYCSVVNTLKPAAEISSSYEVIA